MQEDPHNQEKPQNRENRLKSEEEPETEVNTPEPSNRPKIGTGILFRQLKFILSLIFDNLKELFLKFINIQDTTDAEGTIASIQSGIEVKGYNIWILIASSVLACIGLDTNSAAVIIGAMLISPLMSPILGIGLSVGMNDRKTLSNAAYNFAVAVGISLLTAFVYFIVSPLGIETTEMAARTKPTILDVMVGFFGGVAGIVAGSRKDKTNAIPGVAIATALMPPLCVAGYGLAKFNIPYFAGAFYLFFLNAVFIALSTFLIVRFLDFPVVERITRNLRKNFLRGVVFFVVVSLVPAVLIFIDVVVDQKRDSKIQTFLQDKFGKQRLDFSVEKWEYIDRDKDSSDVLRVTIASTVYLPEDTIAQYEKELNSKYELDNVILKLFQTQSDPNNYNQTIQASKNYTDQRLSEFEADRILALERQKEIDLLKDEIKRMHDDQLPILDIRSDIRDMVPEIAKANFGMLRSASLTDDKRRMDPNSDASVFYLHLTWADSLPVAKAEERKAMLRNRLKNQYGMSQVYLVDDNQPFILPKASPDAQ